MLNKPATATNETQAAAATAESLMLLAAVRPNKIHVILHHVILHNRKHSIGLLDKPAAVGKG
jgi:hypothetical protein